MAEVPACAHLHVHSEYSLLDGACKIDALAARAAELGQPALGLTDHGVMNGSVELYKACRKHGVKPILGLEAYFADDRHSDERQERNHLTLLAATDAGFRNLIQLTSAGYLEGYRRGKPTVDMELLDRHSDGVIALSGCMQSRFNQRLIQGDRVAARAHADDLIQVFGADDFYFEVQENGIPEQAVCNEGTAAIARELGRPLVGTADVHYLTRDDHDHHATLLCVQTKSTRADPKLTFDTNEFFLKSSEEMASAFARWPEAIPTTLEIAERCQTEMSFGGQLIPSYQTPDGSTEDEYLRRISREGLASRYGDPPPAEAVERLEMELGVIGRMGFSAYFLIVWDFVKYAKDSGIAVGPGRGSAAGSIVSYALRITDVDPLAYGLMFERFLNPERVEMPDIDIDFSVRGRGKVIDYVADKYGRESVAQIVTFGKMLPRNATRDAARVLGKEYAIGDRLAKLIPEPVMGRTKTFEDYLKEEPELRRVYQQEPEATEIIDAARGLEGIVRNAGIHAAAVVIADRPLTELVPLQLAEDKSGGERRFKVVTQYAMGPIAELGLLKMDFLGLRNLDVIQDALAIIERAGGTPPDIEALPLDDPKVYEMLARGDSDGVFQMESAGMRDALRKVRPTEFEDLVALVALYRPGAMAHIDTYARNKRAPDHVQYIDERLRAITERTYSVILYQEQSMQIAREIAGFSGAEADHLRKAIGKKKRDQMAALRERFFEGCRASGTSERVIEQLWAVNEAAADYSFNLSHAACYGLIAYRTAWLKANHPVEYMAALISSVMQTKDKVPFYVSRCEEMGIEVLPPDINESGHDFSVGDGRIRFGLDAVKDVGSAAVDRLVEARADGGPFASIWDFCERVDSARVNKKAIEALVKCGAFDCTGDTRTGMLAVLAQAQASGQKTQQDAALGQSSIFDLFEADASADGHAATNGREHPPVPRLPDERGDLNRMEKETLGLFLSNHPVKEVRAALRAAVDCSLGEVAARKDGEWVTVGGIVTESKKIRTRNGSDLMFATLDDLEGAVELLVFAKAIEKCHDALTSDKVLLVRGRVDHKEKGKTTLIVQEVTPFEPSDDEVAAAAEAAGRPPRRVQLVVAPGRPESFLDELREVVGNHPGDDELVLIVGDRRLVLGPEFRVRECPALHVELEQLDARVDAAAA